MMQSLRDNMKLIIWITAIVFLVGFGILELGGVFDAQMSRQGPNGVIAEINGEPIREREFAMTYNEMARQLQENRELQPGEDSYIREQAWQQIVRNTLMRQEARRRGLEATPEEIKMALRVSPPEFLVQAPGFQTNGQFDYRKYLAELDNPNSQVPWAQVEAMVAANLPIQKLQEQVVAAAKVSQGDIRDRFLLQNEQIRTRLLVFRPDSFAVDTTRIGGADVEAYYKAHPEEFSGPEEVRIAVLLVPRRPDASDFSAARERMRTVLDQARAEPDSFESLARTYSEIQSRLRGGDPGTEPFFDEIRPAFQQGLRNVAVGQVSDIIQEEQSLHIFRVDQRRQDPVFKRDRIKYKEIAIRVIPGANAIRVTREKVADVAREAKRSGFAATATKMGLRTFESQFFRQGQSGNDVLQRFPEVETWMFRAKPGSISRPVPTEAGWFLYQVVASRDEGTRPLSSVEREAKAALIRSLKFERARDAAQKARAELARGDTEAAVAARHGATPYVAEGVTRNGLIGPLGVREPRVAGALFAMPVGQWSAPLRGESNVYLGNVESHVVPSEQEFQQQEAQVRESLLGERRQLLFVEWMNELRRRAKIEDYREQYFEA